MDPSRNPALQNSKIQALLNSQQQTSSNTMPPPPAYHMVVDPNAPVPNAQSPYEPQEEDDEVKEEEDETPEITINAATQIRGHGNIISIAQMDTARIAQLVAVVLNGTSGMPSPVPFPAPAHPHGYAQAQAQTQAHAQTQPQASQQAHTPEQQAASTPEAQQSPKPEERQAKTYPKINITINCGATVIGDRNIVGPGLGDIARHMQLANRTQALQHQHQQQQHQQNQLRAAQNHATLYQSQAAMMGVHGPTPPMSRTSSLGSENGHGGVKKEPDENRNAHGHCAMKRKAEETVATGAPAKKHC